MITPVILSAGKFSFQAPYSFPSGQPVVREIIIPIAANDQNLAAKPTFEGHRLQDINAFRPEAPGNSVWETRPGAGLYPTNLPESGSSYGWMRTFEEAVVIIQPATPAAASLRSTDNLPYSLFGVMEVTNDDKKIITSKLIIRPCLSTGSQALAAGQTYQWQYVVLKLTTNLVAS